VTESPSSQRPYLLRAMHQWMTDNDLTPHIVVDAGQDSVFVPAEHVKDDKIILNVGYSATRDLEMSNEDVSFEARFDGVAQNIQVPIEAVLGIYARETGQGMVFSNVEEAPDPPDGGSGDESPEPARRKGPPDLRVVK
jgi:stringent starvation protein B